MEIAGISGTSDSHRRVATLAGFVTAMYLGLVIANPLRQNFRMDARTRLWVVDDDASVRSLPREYLEGHGYSVAEAATGAEMRGFGRCEIDVESRRMFEVGMFIPNTS